MVIVNGTLCALGQHVPTSNVTDFCTPNDTLIFFVCVIRKLYFVSYIAPRALYSLVCLYENNQKKLCAFFVIHIGVLVYVSDTVQLTFGAISSDFM